MTFSESVKTCLFKKFFDFSGRASRCEYWWFFLFFYAFIFVSSYISAKISVDLMKVFGYIYILLFIPFIAVGARRLHDMGTTGWWQLFIGVPFLNLVLFLSMARGSKPDVSESNDPKDSAS